MTTRPYVGGASIVKNGLAPGMSRAQQLAQTSSLGKDHRAMDLNMESNRMTSAMLVVTRHNRLNDAQ